MTEVASAGMAEAAGAGVAEVASAGMAEAAGAGVAEAAGAGISPRCAPSPRLPRHRASAIRALPDGWGGVGCGAGLRAELSEIPAASAGMTEKGRAGMAEVAGAGVAAVGGAGAKARLTLLSTLYV